MSVWVLLLISEIMAASAFVQSAIGIGFAMLASAVFGFLLSPAASSALIGYGTVILGIAYSIIMRRHINIKVSLPPMFGMMISRILGVVTLMYLKPAAATRILGLVLLAFSLYFWRFSGRVRIRPTPWKGFVLGLCAGYLGGLYGLSGPFTAIYFYSVLDDNREYAACMNFSFLPGGILGLLMHMYYGNITGGMFPAYALSTAAVLIGVWIGLKCLNKLDYRGLAKAIYLFMAVMGLVILMI